MLQGLLQLLLLQAPWTLNDGLVHTLTAASANGGPPCMNNVSTGTAGVNTPSCLEFANTGL